MRNQRVLRTRPANLLTAIVAAASCLVACGADVQWRHLSSKTGDLPPPNQGNEQTSSIVLDIDKDGTNDFVITERTQAPSVVWYRRGPTGWTRYLIEDQPLHIEAGSCFMDVDGDGDLDIICGADYMSNEVWWWENPYPNFDPNVPWKRHLIKAFGAHKHHDQIVGDFLGTGKDQLVFWNQDARKLYLAKVPEKPREATGWECTAIYSYSADSEMQQRATYPSWKNINEHEGLAKADIDGDGKLDIVAGGLWFKHLEGMRFEPEMIDASYTMSRCAAGQLIKGGRPEVVLVGGDGIGPLIMYEWQKGTWAPKVLLPKVTSGHSLSILDADGDGNLDIFCAEMRLDGGNPEAKCYVLYGDGKGNFRTTVAATGIDFHESKMADLDGNGTLDILRKPYNFDTPRLDVFLNEGPAPQDKFPGASFTGPLGLELYSLRQMLATNVTAALQLAKALGFDEVEAPGFYRQSPITFRALLDQNGLKCTALVAPYEVLRDDIEGVSRDASILGAKYVICGWIPHNGDFTAGDCERAVADFNRCGEILKRHGITFCYHPHGYEFRPAGAGTLFDVMARTTKPEAVSFQADVFWIAHAGVDPVKLLQQYPGRFPLVHLKELRRGTPTGVLTGTAPDEASVSVGTGQLDVPAILKECAKQGVKRYYLEDEAPSAAAQIPASVEFLKHVRF